MQPQATLPQRLAARDQRWLRCYWWKKGKGQ